MPDNDSRVIEYDFSRDEDAATQRLDEPSDAHAAAQARPAVARPDAGRAIPGYSDIVHQRRKKSRRTAAIVAVAACACMAALVVGLVVFMTAPVRVTVDGNEVTVGGDRTLEEAFTVSGASVKPGNLVAVDGSLLEEGVGNAFSATVNGEEESDPERRLSEGDSVVFKDGGDVEEEASVAEERVPYGATIEGQGAVHIVEGEGVDGMKTTKTGSVSGLTAESVTQEPTNVVCKRFNIDTGGEKVIALTFDDGPHTAYTTHVLDTLAANGAKATFFTVGDRITGDNVAVVKRAMSEGHQISTHSFDHAGGSGQGVNLGYMTAEEQVAEIEKGYEAIESATGAPASRAIRTPGGNFGENVIVNLQPLIDSEIGWNIDTHDWQRPGAGAIEAQILSAKPGNIILMHDGGGDRSQTVEALKSALPKLAAQGYRFVTIDELLKYAS